MNDDRKHHHHHGFMDAEEMAKVLDDPARDVWQQPDVIVQALELTPTMRVAEVGAGTGYFAVRLANALPAGEVIATDVEPAMLRYLDLRARREHLPQLRTTLATLATSGLAAASVDRILIVHLWHHLANRVAYARDLRVALRPGGKLFVVDFALDSERGPPTAMRLSAETLIAELEEAGFTAMLSAVASPGQYLVEAQALGLVRSDGREPPLAACESTSYG